MIMSPFVLDRNVPLIGPPKGGQIGADRNEQGGVRKSGSAGAGAEQAAARGGCGATDACELPAGEAVVEALSGGRGRGTEARQRGAIVESRSRCEVQKEGAAAGAREVRWAGGRAFRTDAGGGTLGVRGWAEGGCRNAATLDAGGRAVESRAEASAASSSTRAQGTLWGTGANGRQFSPLAGRTWSGGLLDRHGRRRPQHDVGATGGARDDLGGGRWVARLDRTLRSAASVVCGLEESVQAAGHAGRTVARRRADHAVWGHVREVGNRGHRCQFAASEGARGEDARHASGSAGKETAAEANPQSRSRQRVPGAGVFAGTQPAGFAGGGGAGGPSPWGAAGRGIGPDFRAGKRTHDQRGLGGAIRQSVFSTATAESPLHADAGQGVGVRRAARQHGHRVPRARAALAGDPRARQAGGACCGWPQGTAHCGFDRKTKVGAASESSVARSRAPSIGETSEARVPPGCGRQAIVVGLALRFALNAPPYGLRRASLRARPTTNKRRRIKNEKGDISNEVRKGTFLKRLDINNLCSLTCLLTKPKMSAKWPTPCLQSDRPSSS